jgi:hypothetical protein
MWCSAPFTVIPYSYVINPSHIFDFNQMHQISLLVFSSHVKKNAPTSGAASGRSTPAGARPAYPHTVPILSSSCRRRRSVAHSSAGQTANGRASSVSWRSKTSGAGEERETLKRSDFAGAEVWMGATRAALRRRGRAGGGARAAGERLAIVRVQRGGTPRWSGWRTPAMGPHASGRAKPSPRDTRTTSSCSTCSSASGDQQHASNRIGRHGFATVSQPNRPPLHPIHHRQGKPLQPSERGIGKMIYRNWSLLSSTVVM